MSARNRTVIGDREFRIPVDIRDQRMRQAETIAEMRSLIEGARAEGRDMSGDELANHRMLFDRAASLRSAIDASERERELQRLEAERAGPAAERARALEEGRGGRGDPRLDAALAGYSLRRAICAGIPDLARTIDCRREVELSQELARRSPISPQGMLVPFDFVVPRESRVVTTALPAAGPGGLIIPTDYRPDLFIDLLRAALIVRRLGATTLMGLTGDVEIPALKKSVTFGWVAENTALTPSDPEYRSVTLTPKHAGGIAEYSRNLLLQSSPDVDRLLAMDFAAVLAEGLDRAAINGSGTAPEPRGILNTSGIGDVPAAGTPTQPTWATVMDLIAAVETANAVGSGFAMSPKVRALLRKTKRGGTSGTDSIMVQESPTELAGYAAAVSSVVPDTALIFASFQDLLIGIWSEFDLAVNSFADSVFSKGNTLVRGMMTVDINVRHAASFAATKNIAYV